jgi:hypothetical protein
VVCQALWALCFAHHWPHLGASDCGVLFFPRVPASSGTRKTESITAPATKGRGQWLPGRMAVKMKPAPGVRVATTRPDLMVVISSYGGCKAGHSMV